LWLAQPLDLSHPLLVFPPTLDKSHRRTLELLANYQKQMREALAKRYRGTRSAIA
jgi:hypothetical protein